MHGALSAGLVGTIFSLVMDGVHLSRRHASDVRHYSQLVIAIAQSVILSRLV